MISRRLPASSSFVLAATRLKGRTRRSFRTLHGGWQTSGVVFVADALGWLVGQLADAGRKKLTGLVLGGEQERALVAEIN
jgi:hypothetical protein